MSKIVFFELAWEQLVQAVSPKTTTRTSDRLHCYASISLMRFTISMAPKAQS